MFKTVEEHLRFFDFEGKLIAALATDSTMPLFRASEMFNKQATSRNDGTLLVISLQKADEDKQDMVNLSTDTIGYFIFAGKINQSRGSE